jgi:SAM-dependent methyltransferase
MNGMTASATHAPGVPTDYYTRIHEFEERHWWYRGMRRITEALLGERLRRDGQRVLDAGCGTGGTLAWMAKIARPSAIAGVDVASAAIELARQRVPHADLHVAPLSDLPFPDDSFDLVLTSDVLQHVPERDVDASLRELRRVLAAGGVMLLRTNGSARLRRERDDWRAYDRTTLERELTAGGFRCERITYANLVLSLWAAARRRVPHAPSEDRHGLPTDEPHPLKSAVAYRLLDLEARYLAATARPLPYGHTLFAVAAR